MIEAPRGVRMHVGVFGRRNVGKSSLLNALVGQDVAIVSDTPGTTTDVVAKAFELKPVGPVLFLDTAGIDDEGALGEKRVARTMQAMERVDLGIVVCDREFGLFEKQVLSELKARKVAAIVAFNKLDLGGPSEEAERLARAECKNVVKASAADGAGIGALRDAIIRAAPSAFLEPPGLLDGLVNPGDVVVLVVPIDQEAPKGRLILPQVQVLREVLDRDARAIVIKETELKSSLELLQRRPSLVVTDSQVIQSVAREVPADIPLTGFSVLFARWKGDLAAFVEGTRALECLKPGSRVLILEACSHHAVTDDIGREKIPRWLQNYVGGELRFEHFQGHDFPADLSAYDQIIMCGSCMVNRREVLSKLVRAAEAGVPMSNYGLCIAYSLGVFERMISPFPNLARVDKHGDRP